MKEEGKFMIDQVHIPYREITASSWQVKDEDEEYSDHIELASTIFE